MQRPTVFNQRRPMNLKTVPNRHTRARLFTISRLFATGAVALLIVDRFLDATESTSTELDSPRIILSAGLGLTAVAIRIYIILRTKPQSLTRDDLQNRQGLHHRGTVRSTWADLQDGHDLIRGADPIDDGLILLNNIIGYGGFGYFILLASHFFQSGTAEIHAANYAVFVGMSVAVLAINTIIFRRRASAKNRRPTQQIETKHRL